MCQGIGNLAALQVADHVPGRWLMVFRIGSQPFIKGEDLRSPFFHPVFTKMSEASLVGGLHYLDWMGLGDGNQRHLGWVAPNTAGS